MVTDAFRTFVLDQLAGLENITATPMFGGVGLYQGGTFFGIIVNDTLFLKVDDRNRSDYERERMPAFRPYRNRPSTMKYRQVPLAVLESAVELTEWTRKAIAAAGAPSRTRRTRTSAKRRRE